MGDVFKIGIIGLGYVGLPLARLFLEKSHTVYGIDVDSRKIELLQTRKSYLSDVTNAEVKQMFAKGTFHVSSTYDPLAGVDVIIICVPTPLDKQSQPDLTYVREATQNAIPYLQRGQLVILESSTYPGTTEEELQIMIEAAGFHVGKDISLVYSPERIDPGQKSYALHEIPKIVGGVTPSCAAFGKRVYESIFDHVVVVSSPKVAEMAKIVENSQRFVNISFMNELAMLCDEMNIDVWEVIAAASTKPYGFVPFYPGPGIGGHCIPVDPLYLLWKASLYNFDMRFIEVAHWINEQMPNFIIKKVEKSLPKSLADSRVLVIGVTYKKDVNDVRESKAIRIIEGLVDRGAKVNYYDPFIKTIKIHDTDLDRVSLTRKIIRQYDCVLILTDHSNIPFESVVSAARLVIDTRNVTRFCKENGNVVFM